MPMGTPSQHESRWHDMKPLVLGALLVLVGLALAFDVGGFGSAWRRPRFGWARSPFYFWGMAGCGGFFVLIGMQSLH